VREFENTNWWNYSDEKMRDLMKQSYDLMERESRRVEEYKEKPYHDYGFIVFPAAKAYEGFLKRVFLDMGMITSQQYYSDHFRIGRALSPTLPKRYRSGWVYGKLIENCHGEELPMAMWEVWKKGRNRTFHFFPQHEGSVSLEEAKLLVYEISQMMGKVLEGCQVNRS
jgi:hypothetical protein